MLEKGEQVIIETAEVLPIGIGREERKRRMSLEKESSKLDETTGDGKEERQKPNWIGNLLPKKNIGLDSLYVLHKDSMYRIALKALDGNQQKALDIVKRAFLFIGNHMDQIRDENSKRTKALMIAAVKSVLNDVYHETRVRIGIPEGHENPRATMQDILRINQVLVRNDLVADLARYVEKLSFEERELVFYLYFAFWSQEELAKHMGISLNELKARLFRAKKKLAKLMTNG